MNRGHDLEAFVDASRRAQARGLRRCAHVILGLPGEGPAHAREAANLLRELDYEGLKLHMLYISRGTRLSEQYADEAFPLLERDEYVSLACDVLERIPGHTVIHRLVSDCDAEHLVAPQWLSDKRKTLDAIKAELVRRETHQGILVQGNEL